jgi:hypothetical protein
MPEGYDVVKAVFDEGEINWVNHLI